jgi:hypothetical protein
MNSFWRFLRDKRNQQILGWIGGGLVVVATGLWAAFLHFFPPQNSPAVRADCSGIAVGGNVTGSTITSGGTTNTECAPKPK